MQFSEDCIKSELIPYITEYFEEKKEYIYSHFEQQIMFWLLEEPTYLFQLFYHNCATEIEYAELIPVGILNLSEQITVGDYLNLYAGRQVPSCHVPGGWEYPTIGDCFRDYSENILQEVGIEAIKSYIIKNHAIDYPAIIQQKIHIGDDSDVENEVAEAVFMKIKDMMNEYLESLYYSFLEERKDCLVCDTIQNNSMN